MRRALRFEAHLTKKFQFYHVSLNAITDDFVRFEAHLSRTLLGVLRRNRECLLIVNFYFDDDFTTKRNVPLTRSFNVTTSLSVCFF